MNAISTFSFENASIRVYGSQIAPLFVASDVCKALGIQNVTQALKSLAPFERSMLNIGRQGNVNVVTEGGLYTLMLRCRNAVKEGTLPYRFRLWVTTEVLPSIRKNGAYVNTISPCQQQTIKEAVSKRSKATGMLYSSIYHRIHQEFKIARYDQLLAKDFEDCVVFVNSLGNEKKIENKPALTIIDNEKIDNVGYCIDLTIDHFHALVKAEKALYETARQITNARVGLFAACKEARLYASLLKK